jgi:hypothetical protein
MAYRHKLTAGEALAEAPGVTTKFLALTAVILPALPNVRFTQFGLNPFKTWLLVVAVCGISYGSYVLLTLTKQSSGVLLSGVVPFGSAAYLACVYSCCHWMALVTCSAPEIRRKWRGVPAEKSPICFQIGLQRRGGLGSCDARQMRQSGVHCEISPPSRRQAICDRG